MTETKEPKLIPLGWRVLVRVDESKPEGGVVLPEGYVADKTRGVVVRLGDGRVGATATLLEFPVKAGDHVLMGPYAVMDYHEDGVEYRLVSCEDILGILP
jgi:co-chaperonin GroES (HSP10)